MKKLAKELPEGKRRAQFRTVISFATPTGSVHSTTGSVKGVITRKPLLKILEGYPYRSFFYLPKIKKYYHEMDLSPEETTLYNHRWKALKKLLPVIKRELGLSSRT